MKRLRSLTLGMAAVLVLPPVVQAQQTWFSNRGSIVNTRHNFTQSPAIGVDNYRNNDAEICVYCHTPQADGSEMTAPLWNQNFNAASYPIYDQLNSSTLTRTMYQPGAASLMCLSCHDGQQAVDAILHTRGSGTDLRNTHPVRVTFPAITGVGTGWKTPTGMTPSGDGTTRFFDDTPNGSLDKNEIRLYDSGNGVSVECASCHDPHGVPSGGSSGELLPNFLRKSNTASALCLTCHSK